MNKYDSALGEAILAICDYQIPQLLKHYSPVSMPMIYRNNCVDLLRELRKLLDTPKGKQLLQELDLEESK